jgi:L-alanine-DL-glutamate epimerase-like enolase superfamily enzyme
MRIVDVKCHELVEPGRDATATSSAQDTIVVEVIADDGTVGIGETDLNPVVARACIEAPSSHSMAFGLRDLVHDQDPLDIEALWQRLYVGSAMTGRRGAGINAIGAIDLALHDLRGKLLGRPAWQELADGDGAAPRAHIRPYASLQPDEGEIDRYAEALVVDARAAVASGFAAAKLSLTFAGPYAHKGIRVPWSRATELLAEVRAAVGPEFTIMVDVQYAFASVSEALGVLADWEPYDLFFVETPLWVDDLDGYATLSREQPIAIAMGEWLTTHHEFAALLERGCVSVVQPDIGRVGGLTEAVRVAKLAADAGATVVPHLWKTGISIAAALHFAAVTPHCPFIEFLPSTNGGLRRELLTTDFEISGGSVAVPTAPGLGVELDRDAMSRFEVGQQDFEFR